MPSTPQVITSPERIRALAHPIRLELLDFLQRDDVDEATATMCAAETGESVASCSFHLRILEKYGFVERAERRGREKPWKVVTPDLDMRPTEAEPGSRAAIAEVASMLLLREGERVRQYLGRIADEPEEWIGAVTLTRSSFWATAEETDELSRTVRALTDRFAGRGENPDLRPEGARHAHLFAVVNPDPR